MRRDDWSDGRRAFALGLLAIGAVTLWRVALLPFDRADLFVDDAQYWFWGQQLAWGYYSKPPLIAWILRLSTSIGSDSPFWIRLPLPLIWGFTSVVVALIARRLYGARAGAVAGFGFSIFPAVSVASLLVSTDTPLLACFAVAMLALIILAERRSVGWAVVLGAAVGVGMLAKYAMIYFAVSAVIAAVVTPRARISWRDAAIAIGVGLLIIAPNVVWNLQNGFSTLQHTVDNTKLEGGAGVYPLKLLGFIGGQFGVAGPVFFAAYLAGLRRVASDDRARLLALLSLPTFLIVSVQALIAGAHTNWAAAGHVAAAVLAAAVLAPRPRWLAAGLALNGTIALALPLATTVADSFYLGDRLALYRYVGRAAASHEFERLARAQGLDTIVATNRDILADLFYTLRDSDLAFYAEPVDGFPPHHYAQKHPLPPGPGEVLFVGRGEAPTCRPGGTPGVEIARWRPTSGYVTTDFAAFRVPRTCWFPEG